MPTHRRIDVALLAVAVVWGSSYLAAKDVVTPDTVFGFLAIRFALAAIGLIVVLGRRLVRISRAEAGLGAVFGAILAVIFTLETVGITRTSASNAGLIISLTVVMTPLLQRSRPPKAFYAAAVLAVLGVGLLTQSGGFSAPGLGDLLILLAAAARACHVVVMAELSRGRRPDPGRLTLVQIGVCLAVFTAAAPLTGRDAATVAAHLSFDEWLIIGYLALGCTVFAFVVQAWAVHRTSPARVSLLLGTEPLWAAGVGVAVAGDPVTIIGVAGAALILVGTNWGRRIVVAPTSDRDHRDRCSEHVGDVEVLPVRADS